MEIERFDLGESARFLEEWPAPRTYQEYLDGLVGSPIMEGLNCWPLAKSTFEVYQQLAGGDATDWADLDDRTRAVWWAVVWHTRQFPAVIDPAVIDVSR